MFTLISVGSPIVDYLAFVADDFLAQNVRGEKGGMCLIDAPEMATLVEKLPQGYNRALGGAAANTARALGRMGVKTAVLGKLGNDATAQFYREGMLAAGVSDAEFKYSSAQPNALCLSLITPDAQRTMRTSLAAAATLAAAEITERDLAATYVYIEGYVLFNQDLAEHIFKTAKNAGAKIALNCGSFEVVRFLREPLAKWLTQYVDLLFANSDEAREFFGSAFLSVDDAAKKFTEYDLLAAVTDGASGAAIADKNGETVRVAALPPTKLVDTTGAGDFWAAGFLYGVIKNYSLKKSGEIAAQLAREIIAQTGVDLPAATWEKLRLNCE